MELISFSTYMSDAVLCSLSDGALTMILVKMQLAPCTLLLHVMT